MKKLYCLGMNLALAGCLLAAPAMAGNHGQHEGFERGRAKNIIFMVPDGMGLADVTATRIFENGPNGERLAFEKMPVIGYQSTFSADSTITDSAAAASAWAIGEKVNNGEISCHSQGNENCTKAPATILEIAKKMGKATGLVVTSQISHATPAVFGAHTKSRNCGAEIARQYIEETGVDVILGGGIYKTKDYCANYTISFPWTTDGDNGRPEIVDSAFAHGYDVVETKSDLIDAMGDHPHKLLGMFDPTNSGKTVEMFRVDPSVSYPAEEPTLAEMTDAALDILEKDRDGFFLMVEGSQIDWENHANNGERQIAETLGFEKSVQAVLDWVGKKENRKKNTLVVVVADHETGGYAINGPSNRLNTAGEIVEAGWTSGGHTGVDTIIWAQGPGSKGFGRALDNTDLFWLMKKAMK